MGAWEPPAVKSKGKLQQNSWLVCVRARARAHACMRECVCVHAQVVCVCVFH